jgi:outer membrane protein TolC
MNASFGISPDFQRFRPHIARGAVCLAAVLLAAAAGPARAERGPPLTLAEAERLAAEAEPGRQALEAGAAALGAKAGAAGALPDPVLRVGINNFPIESGDFATEGMTHAAIGLRQAFPPAGSRTSLARQYRELANATSASAETRARDVLLATRSAWLDVYYLEHARELVLESRPLFAELATISRSLYAVGRRSQQDVIRAELELSRLDDRLIDIERQQAGARAALSEWIGDAALRPVADKLPAWSTVADLGTLEAALREHPALAAAAARVEAQNSGVSLAETRAKPGWAVELGYSYREGLLPDGSPRSDFVSLNVSIDLPYFRKTAVDSSLTAALHDRSAARAEGVRLERSLRSRLAAEHSRWRDVNRRLALYEARILEQARAQATASLNAYQSEKGDFAEVMRAYIDDLNTRIDYIRLTVERAKSYAALASLGGFEQ